MTSLEGRRKPYVNKKNMNMDVHASAFPHPTKENWVCVHPGLLLSGRGIVREGVERIHEGKGNPGYIRKAFVVF